MKSTPVAVDSQGRPIAAGHYLVMLKGNADPDDRRERPPQKRGDIADRAFRHAFRGFAAKLDKAQRAAMLADPNVAAVVPDEVVEIEAQSMPTGISGSAARRPRRYRRSTGSTSGSMRMSRSSIPGSALIPT